MVTIIQLKNLYEKMVSEVEDFKEQVSDFVKEFGDHAPFEFSIGSDTAYELLAEWNVKRQEIENDAQQLNEQQELFEVAVLPWRDLKTCRGELGQLKLIWDFVTSDL